MIAQLWPRNQEAPELHADRRAGPLSSARDGPLWGGQEAQAGLGLEVSAPQGPGSEQPVAL